LKKTLENREANSLNLNKIHKNGNYKIKVKGDIKSENSEGTGMKAESPMIV
jgi:hypothetical protein